jgi:hypothetical protein
MLMKELSIDMKINQISIATHPTQQPKLSDGNLSH